jgi:hypothetical protein
LAVMIGIPFAPIPTDSMFDVVGLIDKALSRRALA